MKGAIIDPLNELTSEAHRLASQARRAFLEGHPETCKVHLSELTRFLGEESISELYAKYETAEPSAK